MNSKIKEKIDDFNRINDVHQYQILLDAANLFIDSYTNGVTSNDELDLGISLLRELIGIAMIGSLPEYEYDYDLQREIRHKKIKVFKLCIPSSHKQLRGLTEMLLGMQENSVG
jgi:hypothetical protein